MVRRPPSSPVTLQVTGVLTQGAPIEPTDDTLTIAADKVAGGEVVYRVGYNLPSLGLAAGDFLIVERRRQAATGEFVIVTLDETAFVGRWWTKHGRRALLDGEFQVIVENSALRVLGAVTLIARDAR